MGCLEIKCQSQNGVGLSGSNHPYGVGVSGIGLPEIWHGLVEKRYCPFQKEYHKKVSNDKKKMRI